MKKRRLKSSRELIQTLSLSQQRCGRLSVRAVWAQQHLRIFRSAVPGTFSPKLWLVSRPHPCHNLSADLGFGDRRCDMKWFSSVSSHLGAASHDARRNLSRRTSTTVRSVRMADRLDSQRRMMDLSRLPTGPLVFEVKVSGERVPHATD